jgi:hypothetical protein
MKGNNILFCLTLRSHRRLSPVLIRRFLITPSRVDSHQLRNKLSANLFRNPKFSPSSYFSQDSSTADVTITDEVDEGDVPIDVGRVGAWATDFARLLRDPVGLQTFAEFLKKEFSAENIIFWVSCERYRRKVKEDPGTPEDVRHGMAMAIVDRHLQSGCPDPVNVDSIARQAAIDGMATLKEDLFALAQKQIYNLMKFDSYSRFLKSDLYKDSLMSEMSETELPFSNALVIIAKNQLAWNFIDF